MFYSILGEREGNRKRKLLGRNWPMASISNPLLSLFAVSSSPVHCDCCCVVGSANQTNPSITRDPRTSSGFKFPRQSSPPGMEAARESMAALLNAGLFGPAQTLVRVPRSLPPLPSSPPYTPCARISRVSAFAGRVWQRPRPLACDVCERGWVAALGDGTRFPSQQWLLIYSSSLAGVFPCVVGGCGQRSWHIHEGGKPGKLELPWAAAPQLIAMILSTPLPVSLLMPHCGN